MDIRQLTYFITVAKHLNFTAAAKHLYVAQSVVSRQIAELEKQLGLRLLDRDKHKVELTAAGALFLKDAMDIVARSDEAVHKLRQTASGVAGRIKLGFLSLPIIHKLPDFVRKLHQTYPNIEIDMCQLNAGDLTDALAEGDVDVGFTRSFIVQHAPRVCWKTVYTDTVSVVARCDHPCSSQARVNVADLRHERYVISNRQQSPSLFDLMLRVCTNRGFSPNIVRQPLQMETVLLMVEAEIGISVLPRCFELWASPALRFLDIDGDDGLVDVVAAWKPTNPNPSLPVLLQELDRSLPMLDYRKAQE